MVSQHESKQERPSQPTPARRLRRHHCRIPVTLSSVLISALTIIGPLSMIRQWKAVLYRIVWQESPTSMMVELMGLQPLVAPTLSSLSLTNGTLEFPLFIPLIPSPVVIFPRDSNLFVKGELEHFIHNGVSHSTKLNGTDDPDTPGATWLVDVVRY